ncbi:cerebellin-4-like [Penaeus chinensis]|uniref:cerebellin-4-like n=1 Tax=Penaeus chinensis TaxID=139456 RepID=UPI001FB62970|nr:cerebellin-4-like [Penaeus chinensis]
MARLIIATLAVLCGLASGQGDRGPQSVRIQSAPFPNAPPPPQPRPIPGSTTDSLPPEFRCLSAFSVRKATQGSLTARNGFSTRVRFQDVLTAEGGWSPSENDFLAPCRGLYYFSFHGVAQDGGDFTLALMKNGQYQVTAYGGKGNYQQGSNSALLLLNKGDLVHLELQQGSLYEHPSNEAYVSFSGFLVKSY